MCSDNLIYPGQSLTIPGASGGQGGGQGGTPTATENGTTPTFNDQNLYDWGQCTWHVFNRRAETGCNHLLEHCLPNFQRSTNKC